jgi:hypothetical protein
MFSSLPIRPAFPRLPFFAESSDNRTDLESKLLKTPVSGGVLTNTQSSFSRFKTMLNSKQSPTRTETKTGTKFRTSECLSGSRYQKMAGMAAVIAKMTEKIQMNAARSRWPVSSHRFARKVSSMLFLPPKSWSLAGPPYSNHSMNDSLLLQGRVFGNLLFYHASNSAAGDV